MKTGIVILLIMALFDKGLLAQADTHAIKGTGNNTTSAGDIGIMTINHNSSTTLSSNPNTLLTSGFYQNNTNNNPLLPGTHHGLLLNIASYWDDNFGSQIYMDYSTPGGIVTPHMWYRFSNIDGYTGWYRIWNSDDDGAGSGLDADLIRGQAPQWKTSGSTVYSTNAGNILIGKTTQSNTSYKLDVNGNIRANKVVVNTTGADYVFDSAYQLPSIDSLENYIRQHHHLPGVAPAYRMQEQGVDVGYNQEVLLKKIEELSLYLIEMKKEQTYLRAEIKRLKEQNRQLVKQIQQVSSGCGELK